MKYINYMYNKLFACMIVIVLLLASSCRSKKQIISGNSNSIQLQKKYAQLLQVNESAIDNIALYRFVDEWLGVPYKYAGKDKNGTDCSWLTAALYKEIFNTALHPPAWSIYNECKPVLKEALAAGDLVFFKIDSEKISHVGIYLCNNYFVHASTSKGVIISSLEENYYKKHFFAFGKP